MKKTIVLLWLIVLATYIAVAQETQELSNDSIIKEFRLLQKEFNALKLSKSIPASGITTEEKKLTGMKKYKCAVTFR